MEQPQPPHLRNQTGFLNNCSSWTNEDVTNWLNQTDLGYFSDLFKEREIDGWTLLKLQNILYFNELFPNIRESEKQRVIDKIKLLEVLSGIINISTFYRI